MPRGRTVGARPGTHQPTREGDELARDVGDLRRQSRSFGPFGEGVALKDVALTATAKEFRHGLGRVPHGFLVTDLDASATVYRTAKNRQTITLRASTNVTASVWVY